MRGARPAAPPDDRPPALTAPGRKGANPSVSAPHMGMTLQAITYRGRLVAAATRSRFFLAENIDRRPSSDPERTFIVFMCAYAGDVLNGVLPGPYTDQHARAYARACLIPRELVERPTLDLHRAACALQVPVDELRAERNINGGSAHG